MHEFSGPEGTHGLFSYHFLAGLKGQADSNCDGIITSAELWAYVNTQVLRTAENDHYVQTPQYGREGEGEFLFANPQQRMDAGGGSTSFSLDDVYSGSHALVIGIDDYEHLPKLRGAVRDAQAMAQVLVAGGFDVTLVLNKEATRQGIEHILYGSLPGVVTKDSRLLVFFAGHGQAHDGPGGSLGYLIPVEATEAWQGISLEQLRRELAIRYRVRHTLVVADASLDIVMATR